MLKEQKNSRKQGDIGLGKAISYFTLIGATVCIPLTDNQEYDLIVDLNNELQKVQVKTTYFKKKSNNYAANLKISGGNRSRTKDILFDNSKVDIIFILTEENTMYLIPAKEIKNTTQITLYEQYNKYIIK